MIEDSPFLTIRRNFPRPDPEKVKALKGVQSGVAVDCLKGSGALHHAIKPVTSSMSPAFTGLAVTCDCGPADNLAAFAALDICQPGDVVMIRTEGHVGCAVIAAQTLPPGVYIAMNGQVFPAHRCRKDRERMRFELTSDSTSGS